MKDNSERLYERNFQFIAANIGADEVVLFNPEEPENYFGLKETALDIWNFVEHPATMSEIVAKLSDIYDAPEVNIKGDTKEFLEQLVQQQVLKIVEE